MDALMKRFYETWQYLSSHAVFVREEDLNQEPSSWSFMRNVDIQVVHVNPDTNEIDDRQSKNTKVAVWLECGTKGDHDIDLDCGGDSFEEAIIQLSGLVKKKYDE